MPPKRAGKPAQFVQNMWAMLNDPSVKHIVEWEGDDAFVVHKIDEFSEQVLPRLCNSQSFCSFVRQLNGYSWSKADNKKAMFRHELFRRDKPENLPLITRRKAAKRRASGSSGTAKTVAGASRGGGAPSRTAAPSSGGETHQASSASRIVGQEGEGRSLLLSTLSSLKQVVSAALAAEAFRNASAALPGTPPTDQASSLLMTTVQHATSTLIRSHRPDLLPVAGAGPTPRLSVLDVALGHLLMEVSGGVDPSHLVLAPTHGGGATHHHMGGGATGLPPPVTRAAHAPTDLAGAYTSPGSGGEGGGPYPTSVRSSDVDESTAVSEALASLAGHTPASTVDGRTPPALAGGVARPSRAVMGAALKDAVTQGQAHQPSPPMQAPQRVPLEGVGDDPFPDFDSLAEDGL